METFLEALLLADNNAAFNLCGLLCSYCERKAFKDGTLYDAQLMLELERVHQWVSNPNRH